MAKPILAVGDVIKNVGRSDHPFFYPPNARDLKRLAMSRSRAGASSGSRQQFATGLVALGLTDGQIDTIKKLPLQRLESLAIWQIGANKG